LGRVTEVPTVTQKDENSGYGEAIAPGQRPKPGDVILDPELGNEPEFHGFLPEPLVGDDASSPLEEEEPEGTIPPSPLWAMKMRRHVQWHLLPAHKRHDRLRAVIGSGDDALYVIDDDHSHVMIGRRIGTSGDGCDYCIIGRAPRSVYDELAQGRLAPSAVFGQLHQLELCGIAVEENIASSNIIDVDRYETADEIPSEYLPGHPYIDFHGDLEINVD
jgi:hypothetical protein